MGILRLASHNSTKLDLGEGDFVEVKADLSRKEYVDLLKAFPTTVDGENVTIDAAMLFGEDLFRLLVTGWSLEGVEPTVENYLALDKDASNAVDEKLGEHFNALLASPAETKSSARSGK